MKPEWDIQGQAAQWLVRRDLSDAASNGDFERWLAADPRHRAEYLKLEMAWRQTDRLRKLRPLDGGVEPDLLREPAAGRLRRARHLRFGASAVAAAIALALLGSWVYFKAVSGWQSYATQVGGYQRVLLSDGTTMEMNTGTELKVRFDGKRRLIRLLRGEASFRVARDIRRPFDVAAGETTIRAVGTSFNVRLRDPRQIEVLVTEGRVAVARGALSVEPSAPVSTLSTLSAGEAALAEAGGLVVRDIPAVEVERRLAWQGGELVFQGETLAQAAAEFNRYNRKQLSIGDPSLADLQIGGNFRATDPESFVRALRKSFGIEAQAAADGAGYALMRPHTSVESAPGLQP